MDLDTEQERQLKQLQKAQLEYILTSMERDPVKVLPLLVAALDREQKRKNKYNQWFVESCRQFKDIKAEKCLAVLNHLEPNFKAAHDTVIPLLSLRLLLCRCLGVKLSFKIPALKRQEDQFMEWALVQYTSLCRPLKGWTGWTPEDVWFGQGLVYSLVKPDCENHFGETII